MEIRQGERVNLKPCPFCDGKAKLWERRCDTTKYTIGCTTWWCLLWIPDDVKLRELHNYQVCFSSKKSAIESWNMRGGKK